VTTTSLTTSCGWQAASKMLTAVSKTAKIRIFLDVIFSSPMTREQKFNWMGKLIFHFDFL